MENNVNVMMEKMETELFTIYTKLKESLGYSASESLAVYKTRIDEFGLTLSDGEKHLVFLDKNQYDSKEFQTIVEGIQHTIFGSGKMEEIRTLAFLRRMKCLKLPKIVIINDEEVKVSIVTVASVLMSSKIKISSKYNTYAIMSELSYWLDSTKAFALK